MRVIVLGAGVIGVTTAYYLARAGHEVIVIDRQPGPALETSYANGGQISANHATPWATPTTLWKAIKWLGRRDAPLLFHLQADYGLWTWCLRFLANCSTERMLINLERALRVAVYSRTQLAKLRASTGIQYDQLTKGILHIFRNQQEYQQALPQVELMTHAGCERVVLDADQCLEIEPALAHVRPDLIGGIFSPDDESGDAHAFTLELAQTCIRLGVTFQYETMVQNFVVGSSRFERIDTDKGEISGDACVVALGSYSTLVLKPLGIKLPVYPAKGYSVTLSVLNRRKAPTVSIIDDEFKMVYSRLGNRLRVAGTAEFTGYDTSISEVRARFILNKALELFPKCGDPAEAEFWAGLRPSTPDGVPIIGPTRHRNVFLNTGHGTLGWTMACGAGQLLADLMSEKTPEISMDGLSVDRFS